MHDNFETPPDLPAFRNEAPKKMKQDSLSDTLAGAAVAFVNAFSSSHGGPQQSAQNPTVAGSSVTPVGLSPSKAVDLRMKNCQQLRYLQQLYEDGILTTKEQKEKILSSLRK